jgi:pyruvate dehydrogenase E2 component (dihydrolipoamide acetyltransferase)
MPIDITMPALSPTMETGTLAKWLVRPGDTVRAGDVIAEIETDKATMEVEAVDEGEVLELLVAEGTEEVPVNAVIARLKGEGESEAAVPAPPPAAEAAAEASSAALPAAPTGEPTRTPGDPGDVGAGKGGPGDAEAPARVIASPLARRLARLRGVDLATLAGSGPRGRIVRADVEAALGTRPAPPVPEAVPPSVPPSAQPSVQPAAAPPALPEGGAPFETVRLSNMRKTIARRLTESKTSIPHFYLTVDVRLDALLALRAEVNRALEAQGVKVSVNDMLVKALGLALARVPDANVSFAGDHLRRFQRADVSVAVAIPGGLITPVIRDAGERRLSAIAVEMKDLAARAREGKLKPEEYQGGTASLSNLGMYGIRQFDAVINPPEGLILAVGAGEQRPHVIDGALGIATMMSATGSFDHRAIDGAVGAEFMAAFKALVEAPLAMLA